MTGDIKATLVHIMPIKALAYLSNYRNYFKLLSTKTSIGLMAAYQAVYIQLVITTRLPTVKQQIPSCIATAE